MGKGLFLLTSAMARPDTNFFGIEIVRKYQLYATTRFAIRKLPNVKTVCADARWVLRQFVPAGSVVGGACLLPGPVVEGAAQEAASVHAWLRRRRGPGARVEADGSSSPPTWRNTSE